MRTQVSDSSIKVFHNEIKGRKQSAQADQCLEVIRRHGRCTRKQIAVELGWQDNIVSRAVNDLLEDFNAQVFEERSLFPCPITGRNKHWVYVKREEQMRLI